MKLVSTTLQILATSYRSRPIFYHYYRPGLVHFARNECVTNIFYRGKSRSNQKILCDRLRSQELANPGSYVSDTLYELLQNITICGAGNRTHSEKRCVLCSRCVLLRRIFCIVQSQLQIDDEIICTLWFQGFCIHLSPAYATVGGAAVGS